MSRLKGLWGRGEGGEAEHLTSGMLHLQGQLKMSKLKKYELGLPVSYIPPCTLCKNFMLHNGACTHTPYRLYRPIKISISAYTRGVILH